MSILDVKFNYKTSNSRLGKEDEEEKENKKYMVKTKREK